MRERLRKRHLIIIIGGGSMDSVGREVLEGDDEIIYTDHKPQRRWQWQLERSWRPAERI